MLEDIDICDRDTRDHDAELEAKAKIFTNTKRLAKPSEIAFGDHVLAQQECNDKLSTNFNPVPYEVTDQNGSQLTLESQEVAQ